MKMAFLLAIVLLVGCASGGTRHHPSTVDNGYIQGDELANNGRMTINTQKWGSTVVDYGDCPAVNIVPFIDAAYGALHLQLDDLADKVSLPVLIKGSSALHGGVPDEALQGLYDPKYEILNYRCGSENVITHEMGHRACHVLNLPCDCSLIGHAGGYNLKCEKLP